MPAEAAASFTPAIAGISGNSLGASGETADDMSKFRLRGKEALCITLMLKTGRPVMIVVVPANAGTHNHRRLLLRKATGRVLKDNAAAYGSLLSQGRRDDVEIE